MNIERTASEAFSCKAGAESFLQSKQTQTPLLSKVYLARTKLVHHILDTIAELNDKRELQLLNLGGGLDSSYAKYVNKQYIVDLPTTLANLPRVDNRPSNTCYISLDLKNVDDVFTLLLENEFNVHNKTVILLECVLAYLDPDTTKELLSNLAQRIPSAIIVIYDPICGKNGPVSSSVASSALSFSTMMMKKFDDRKAPLQSAMDSTASFSHRMLSNGWSLVRTFTLSHALQLLLSRTQRKLHVDGELFDEYASLQTLLNLYCLCIASSDSGLFTPLLNTLTTNALDGYNSQSHYQKLNKLYAGIATMEAQVLALEMQKHSSNQPTSTSSKIGSTSNGDNNRNVRAVMLEDIEEIVALYTASFLQFATADKSVKKYVTTATKQLQDLKKKLSPVSSESVTTTKASTMEHLLWVAVTNKDHPRNDGTNNHVQGTIGIKRWMASSASDRFEIVHFCVRGTERQQGIGSLLLETALQYCQSMHATEVQLTLLSSFESARRLYERFGFLETGSETLSPQCTMVHMTKKFDN